MDTNTNVTRPNPASPEKSAAPKPAPAPLKLSPPADVYEGEGGFLVLIDLVGVARDAVSLEVEKDVLTVSANRPAGQLPAATFKRSFALPVEVDQDQIQATHERGVLTLTLTRRASAKPRQIAIKREDPKG